MVPRQTAAYCLLMPCSGEKLAGVTGLEPAASGVTGQRSNQLSYTPAKTTLPSIRTAIPAAAKLWLSASRRVI